MVSKVGFVNNVADLRKRLSSTIVLYNKLPYVIIQIDAMNLINITPCRTYYIGMEGSLVIAFEDPLLDINPFRLGYVNSDSNALFLSRKPLRATESGLCWNAVVSSPPGKQLKGYLYSISFENMIKDEYPDMKDSLMSIRKFGCDFEARSFHRLWAFRKVTNALLLEFMGNAVGFHKGAGKFSLYSQDSIHSSCIQPIKDLL